MELGFQILHRFATFSNSLEYKFSGFARGRFARKFLDLVRNLKGRKFLVDNRGEQPQSGRVPRVAVFPGNNSDLFEKDRGAVGFEHFAEIFCGSCAVGSQIFSTFDTLEVEIASARGAKTG